MLYFVRNNFFVMDSHVFYGLGHDFLMFITDNIVFETVGRYTLPNRSWALPLGVQHIGNGVFILRSTSTITLRSLFYDQVKLIYH